MECGCRGRRVSREYMRKERGSRRLSRIRTQMNADFLIGKYLTWEIL
ncbi:MAG: hypothetical protein AVDCRST_MAG56-2665 [uncultured Cytophagales bacterium]|uniref:Uncharacterized protein n=1 Tax=uncultured Cytophagales bacterium TaxID=158755 RepID=A0A6J4IY68_9SPHI|nr:MAG: hypothetical protein AVDCRST_MAG56-2665 [uncultured Cytophagales bacterium]